MGVLGKLMFWKKKDDFEDLGLGDKPGQGMDLGLGPDLGSEPSMGQDLGMPSPSMNPSQPMNTQQQPFQQSPSFGPPQSPQPNFNPPAQNTGDYTTNKNLEVISSKLDALKAAMESINQRLSNLEGIARGEEDKRYKSRW